MDSCTVHSFFSVWQSSVAKNMEKVATCLCPGSQN